MNIGYDTPFWNKRPPDWDEIDTEKPIASADELHLLICDVEFTDPQMQDYWQRNTEEGDAAADAFILSNIERILSDWRKYLTPSALKSVQKFEHEFDIDFDVLKEVYAI